MHLLQPCTYVIRIYMRDRAEATGSSGKDPLVLLSIVKHTEGNDDDDDVLVSRYGL